MKRYDLCDDTCTVDCGHCKGAGRPVTASSPAGGRDEWAALDDALAAAEAGVWRQRSADDCVVDEIAAPPRFVAECTDPDDAALIAAAVTALPALLAVVRQSAVREARLRALAEEWDTKAEERDRIADGLPDAPSYHMEINRLVVGAEHQCRAAARLRAVLDEEADRGE